MTEDGCQEGSSSSGGKQKRNTAERKEKSRDAARERRAKESDYFQELEDLLPVLGPAPPTSVATTVDKTSLIRLTLAHLKARNFIDRGLTNSSVKEEDHPDVANLDLLSCVDGFSLVLSPYGDVIHVSNNVNMFIGLTSTELTGQVLMDYVHPCDHRQLDQLTPDLEGQTKDQEIEVFVRIKCTVTERGRIINLKQANYKTVRICGKARNLPNAEGAGGLVGTVFMGIVSLVGPQPAASPTQIGVFNSKHSEDMKFTEIDNWLCIVAGYSAHQLMSQSFFDFIHAGDINDIQKCFRRLRDQGQCETPSYRFLAYGGGWTWIKTKACLTPVRRGGNKGQTVTCQHLQITEVEQRDQVLALVQMKTDSPQKQNNVKQNQQISRTSTSGLDFAQTKAKTEEPVIHDNKDILLDVLHFEPSKLIEDILSESETKAIPSRSVIIEPREADKKNKVTVESTTRPVTSTPTSVIVNHKACGGPKAVTQSLFRKVDLSAKSDTEAKPDQVDKNSNPCPPKAVTLSLFRKVDMSVKTDTEAKSEKVDKISNQCPPKAVTASFFSKPKNMLTAGSNHDKTTDDSSKVDLISKVDEDILASLLAFDSVKDLETLAPHGGDDFISIKESENDKLPTFDFEMGHYDEAGQMSSLLTFPEEVFGNFFEKGEDEVFIKPGSDTMWGVPSTMTHPEYLGTSRVEGHNERPPSTVTSDQCMEVFDMDLPKYSTILRGPNWKELLSTPRSQNHAIQTVKEHLGFGNGDLLTDFPF